MYVPGILASFRIKKNGVKRIAAAGLGTRQTDVWRYATADICRPNQSGQLSVLSVKLCRSGLGLVRREAEERLSAR